MTAILIVASLTLIGSFLCSLFEATLYSITPSQLELLRSKGRRGATRLANLKADIDEPIAAILTVNTVTHTVGASACGAMVANEFGSTAVGVFAALFTVAVLLLTEIIPKSIGVNNAVGLGPTIAGPLQVMIWMTWPVVKASSWIMGLFTVSKKGGAPTEDEVVVSAALAARDGHLRPQEQRWVENALRLDMVKAVDLMTPRPVVQFLEAETRLEDLQGREQPWERSRLPLTEGPELDGAVGLVYRREILEALLAGRGGLLLRDLLHPIDQHDQAFPRPVTFHIAVAQFFPRLHGSDNNRILAMTSKKGIGHFIDLGAG